MTNEVLKLKELLKVRNDYKEIQKENESGFVTSELEKQNRFYIAKKLRKKTEKQIFILIENL